MKTMTVRQEFDGIRSRLDDLETNLTEREENATRANDKEYDEQDEANPEAPRFETERTDGVFEEISRLKTRMDAVKRPTQVLNVDFDREVRQLERRADDITLE